MSEPREPLGRIVVAGGGQLAACAALALKRATPRTDILVIGLPVDDAAFADHAATALPFTSQFHERLGITEDAILRSAGGSHRLVVRYFGWGGQGHHAALSYGNDAAPFTGAEDQADRETIRSLADLLARAGRFAGEDAGPSVGIDPCLRWHPSGYRQLLVDAAARAGVRYREAAIAGVERREGGGIAELVLADGDRIAADLFVDCSGPPAALLSSLPEHEVEPWGAILPARVVHMRRPGPPLLALEDRIVLSDLGWRSEDARRDGLHVVSGVGADVSEQDVVQALGGEPIRSLGIFPRRLRFPWVGNVVVLGDAAAWFEPLGFLNLDLAHRQLDLLLELLPGRGILPLEQREYNRRSGLMMDAVRDMLAAHYATPAAQKVFRGDRAWSPELLRMLDQFGRHGRIPFREEAPFEAAALRSMLVALGFPAGATPQSRAVPGATTAADRARFDKRSAAMLSGMPPYRDWLAARLRGG